MSDVANTCNRIYTPYGYEESGDKGGLLGFNGQWFSPLVRGYILGNGYRLFSPALMRLFSPDSFSPFFEGGPNAYAYCAGDPVNKVDPTGHSGRFPRQPLSLPPTRRAFDHHLNARIAAGNRAPSNIYSAPPRLTVEVLMSRHSINKAAASMVLEGVPLPIVRHSRAQKIPLHKNFIEHAKLPEAFLVSNVEEILSTGKPLVIAHHHEKPYYFTLSDNGLNIRDERQWLEKNRISSLSTHSPTVASTSARDVRSSR